MKLLDLFSGIGGFSLAAEYNNIETIGFVEKDKFCHKVLQKNFPGIPIIGDIRDVKRDTFEAVDIISGGFPCQPFSVAGKRRGTDDDRYLWDETIRVVSLFKPRWFVGENVEGIVNIQNGMVLRQVQDDLEKEGFEVQCGIIPASGIGAWHQRKRVWILGNSQHNGSFTTKEQRGNTQTSTGSQKRENSPLQSKRTSRPTDNGNVSNTNSSLRRGRGAISQSGKNKIWGFYNKKSEQTAHDLRSETIRCDVVSGEQEDVSHTNNDGFKRGQSETCNKDASGKNNTSFRGESANNLSRSDDDRGDKKKSRINESVPRSHDGNQKESSTTKGLCDLSEKSDKCSTVDKTSRDQKNNDRTLVQKRQVFQLSNSRGLGDDQASSERDQVRSRNDNTVSHRVDTKNVSNTIGELSDGCSSTTRNSDSKQEWMDSHSQEYKDKVWSETQRCGKQTTTRGNISDTDKQRAQIQTQRQQSGIQMSGSTEQKSWWQTQSELCGVPNGVSYGLDKDRVNQIKSLGNSIVPQIAYQIFKAIVTVEKEG